MTWVTWYWSADTLFDRCQLSCLIKKWMFNIKYVRCKPSLYNLVLAWVLPSCFATSSLGPRARDPCCPPRWPWKRSCMGFYFYPWKWFCSYSYGAPLGDPKGRRSSATIQHAQMNWLSLVKSRDEWYVLFLWNELLGNGKDKKFSLHLIVRCVDEANELKKLWLFCFIILLFHFISSIHYLM